MPNIAVILAAGSGLRFGEGRPKQFAKVAGSPVLAHTLSVFQRHPRIDRVIVVSRQDCIQPTWDIVQKGVFSKVKAVLVGGEQRHDSTCAALRALEKTEPPQSKILFHDAVRPFVTGPILDRTLSALDTANAVDVAISAADTIIQMGEGDIIEAIPERSKFKRGQTPQGFRLHTICRAYALALQDPHLKTTDDCGVVRRYLPDEPILVVEGARENIKITYVEDLSRADHIFQTRVEAPGEVREGGWYRERLFGKTLVIFGGTSGIGASVAKLAGEMGARVFPHGRSGTGVDIRKQEDVQRALASAHAETGVIDHVVNTAAVLRREPLAHMTIEAIEEVLDTNVAGSIHVARQSHPYLSASRGHLLLFTSSSFTRGRAGYSTYSASKAAQVNLTQALAEEWHDENIRVNCVCPERTNTPMRWTNFGKEDPETLLDPARAAYLTLNALVSDFTGQVIRLTREGSSTHDQR